MKPQHIILCITGAALIGLNVVLCKLSLNQFPPLLFTALRFLPILPLALFVPRPKGSLKQIILISCCWGALYYGAVNFALHLGVSAGITVFIVQSSTFITIVLAYFLLKDRPTITQITGTVLGIVGIYLISAQQGFSAPTTGIILLFVAAFSYAFGSIMVKKITASSFSLNVWVAVISFIPMLSLSMLTEDNLMNSIVTASIFDWGIVLFASWGSTLLAGFFFVSMIKRYTLSAVAPYRLLTSVFGSIFAIVILGEVYPIITWVGGGLIIVGLAFAQLKTHHFKIFSNKRKVVQNEI
jgi:O-acetylserine/cysteine efflux transporter